MQVEFKFAPVARFVSRRSVAAAFVGFSLLSVPYALAQDPQVVARVNGEEMTAADLQLAEEAFAPQLGEMPDDARRSILVDALIDMRLAANAARADKIDERDAFKRRMTFLEEQTLRSIYADEALNDTVTDAAVRAVYDEEISKIPAMPETKLSHVLLPTAAEAEDVIEALASGTSFDSVAREKSLDEVSKANGGDLGFLAEDEILPEIASAVADLEAGQFTAIPVESAFGFHVVRVDEIRNRPAPAFEEIGPQIRQALEARAQRDLVAGLRESAEIEKLVPDVAPPKPDDGHQH